MLFRLVDVVVEFGPKRVFGPLSFQQNAGEKLSLLGRNGSGKTTFLRLVTGELAPTHGRVERASRLRVSSFQQPKGELQENVLCFVLSGFPELLALEAERERVAALLPEPSAVQRFAEIEEALDRLGASTARARAQALLQGLGLPRELHTRPLATLSGGQKSRAALARALLAPSDLLLLDEPSNHLDLIGAAFLAQILAERESAALVVTHDRALVDALGGNVLELAGGQLERYQGPFRRYWQQRQARREQQRRVWEVQQAERARQEEFIRRNIAGQNTRQAQARQKLLAKWECAAPPPPDPKPVRLRWPEIRRSGDWVLQVERLAVGYSTPLLQNLCFTLRRGERVAVVGANGSGKTTLLRTLAGQIPPLSGSIRLGTGVSVGYADQEQGPMGSGSPVELLQRARPDWTPAEVRAWAGAFGFSGDNAQVDGSLVSGGERCRLQLATLLAQAPNLLLLDEPTNHLDVPTVQVLEQSLSDFPGSLILVSHDRALVEAVATEVFLLQGVGLQPMRSVAEAFTLMTFPGRVAKAPRSDSPRRSPQAQERREKEKQLGRLERNLAEVEGQLMNVESEIRELEAACQLVAADFEKLQSLAVQLGQAKQCQESLWQRWCQLGEAVERLRKELAEV